MKKQFKIPTLLGILIVAVLVGTLAIATQYLLRNSTQAEAGKMPQHVLITNISDSSFTVTWQTEKPIKGVVQVSENGSSTTPQTFFDERAIPGDVGDFTMHSVAVRGLKASTSYQVNILQDKTVHTAITAPALTLSSNTLGPAYGTVVTEQGNPAVGALVFLALPNSQTLSAVVKPSGSFLVPLNLIRSADLSSYLTSEANPAEITITVQLDTITSTITTDTANASPVPEIILGKTYDFKGKNQQGKRKEDLSFASIANILGTQSTGTPSGFGVSITTPQKGAHITSAYPFITGTGIPDTFITLTLGIQHTVTGSTKVGKDGTWNFTPQKALGIGNQSVTITTIDEQKKPVAITHLFEIMKSGTQVLGSATPSGTIAPTITIQPTVLPTVSPTDIPTPTTTPPVTATVLPTQLIFFIGLILAASGIVALVL